MAIKPFARIFSSQKDFFMPYSRDWPNSSDSCLDCAGPCVRVCPEGIVFRESGGRAYLDFNIGGCTFCQECASACNDINGDIFDLSYSRVGAIAKIEISECLAWNKSICSSCKDACDYDAIEFSGMFYPQIDIQKCSGCGMCVARCSSYCIKMIKGSE